MNKSKQRSSGRGKRSKIDLEKVAAFLCYGLASRLPAVEYLRHVDNGTFHVREDGPFVIGECRDCAPAAASPNPSPR
jgi:hypothetical protein